MKITGISVQARDKDRVNVSVDGKYRFSLDILQVADLGIKIGREYDEAELAELEQESQFGKLYTRALEYSLMRPHSQREVRDYLYRKTRTTMARNKRTGELYERVGVTESVANRVFDRLVQKGYVNDEKFAEFWIENRNLRKGTSRRKLMAELATKGVDKTIVERLLAASDRADPDELQKIIAKRSNHYDDPQKFMAYLARQGFSYDDIKSALENSGSDRTADE